jgi:SulP family sulfate permease
VLDGMSGKRHSANSELMGQGIGNILVPFFGGITATAAIARSAANYRAGAQSPVAAMVHALVVLLALVSLAGVLAYLPMPAMAALLIMVAWNMSEARHFLHTLRSAPPGDVTILVICFGLTVLLDMVLAVAVGVAMAAALFIRRMALLTETNLLETHHHPTNIEFPAEVAIYDINGPLFFGAAEKALASLHLVDANIRTVILDMHDVPSMDGTAIVALESIISEMRRDGLRLILVGLQPRMIVKLRRAGIHKLAGSLTYCRNLEHAHEVSLRWRDE